MFGLITLLLVINYALLGWAKKLGSSKCWWGQCALVMRAIFRICGNENQPGLQQVEKLTTPLSLPLLSDCITFSKPSALQADEVNFLYSTLYSCSTTWRRSKVCKQKEIFPSVLIRGRKGDLIAGEVASSQSLDLLFRARPKSLVSRVTWASIFSGMSPKCIYREGLRRRRARTKQTLSYNWPNSKERHFWATHGIRKYGFLPFNRYQVSLFVWRRFARTFGQNHGPSVQEVHFRLPFVAQTHLCLSSLSKKNEQRTAYQPYLIYPNKRRIWDKKSHEAQPPNKCNQNQKTFLLVTENNDTWYCLLERNNSWSRQLSNKSHRRISAALK